MEPHMSTDTTTATSWLDSAFSCLPENFDLDRQGIYLNAPPRRGSTEPRKVRLTSCPIIVVGRSRDASGEGWSLCMEYLSLDDRIEKITVPAFELTSRQPTLFDHLANRGVVVEPSLQTPFRSFLFASFGNRDLPSTRLVASLGFQRHPESNGWVFVFPDRVLSLRDGKDTEPLVYSPLVQSTITSAYHASGSLDEWKAILAPFADHPLIVFGAVFGLAGPFASLAGIENGGVHLYGETSKGKSTAQQVCASCAGCGADPARSSAGPTLLQRWNVTQNAIEGVLAPNSGMTVVIDEIGANQDGLNLYNVFGGRAKGRLNVGGSMRPQGNWSVQVLSSGELAMSQHIEDTTNQRASGGQSIRMLDASVLDVMELAVEAGAPPMPSAEEMSARIDQLKTDCGRFYGTALPALVEWTFRVAMEPPEVGTEPPEVGMEPPEVGMEPPVLDLKVQIDAFVKDCCDELCAEVEARGAPLLGLQRRAMVRLGLALAIGELAVQAEVVPFTSEQVGRAVRAVRDAWLSTVTHVSSENLVLNQIRDYVVRYAGGSPTGDPRHSAPSGGWKYFHLQRSGRLAFTEEQLIQASGSHNLAAVGKVLHKAGWLYRNDGERNRCRVPAELRGTVPEGRMFLLLAAPILGEFADVLRQDDALDQSRNEGVGHGR